MIRTRRFLVLAGALATGGALWWSFDAWSGGSSAAPPIVKAPLQSEPSSASPRQREISAAWHEVLANCKDGRDPEAIRKQLVALRERWSEEDDLYLVAQSISQLLKTGEDAKTGLRLETGPQGLRGWPTMRVFLLDFLSTADPDLAVEVAREILASTSSAEEYAVALKPLLMKGPWRASDEELQEHFAKLLATPEWQTREGLAEALDLPRVASSSGTADVLARWVDASPPAVEAGEIALHETAAQTPSVLVGLIAEDRTLFEDQPELRASLMARATVSDGGQATEVNAYLRDPAISKQEKESFLALYPLRSATTGYRLYGQPPKPFERNQVVADDQAALQAVTHWMADPAMAELAPSLKSLQGRLQTWVGQAGD
ncbi:hypothetical protein [Luteolibacter luteus]|uniref:HEAT repeat domain-containing protein n=1 Tax=Luteolibacter luteus TaxID=2728835 RepID=A0A858RGT7_9BACT|nr:hypothetical protein [Luteolibacter luteus]QJE95738.1 hypothetical protein HHL09_08045 [Luteolibacter luteus]